MPTIQQEGFSPGMAARCVLEDGRRVFIKAVSAEPNETSLVMARNEIRVAGLLPTTAPVPPLLTAIDDNGWAVAVFASIDGKQPGQPWSDAELGRVVAALDRFAAEPIPADDAVPPLVDSLGDDGEGWAKLAVDGVDPSTIEPWLTDSMLSHLVAIEATWPEHAPPTALIHADVRADNLLIDTTGRVWIVDWANASLGPPWLDYVAMIPSIAMASDYEPDALWALSDQAATVDPTSVSVLLTMLAGFFTEGARRPPSPGIPMLRDFQETQARPARAWLRNRLGW